MMFEGVPVAGLTAPALLGIFFLLMFFGKIVPRSTLEDKIKEAENWRQTAEKAMEGRDTSNDQTAELLELARTSNTVLLAVFGARQQRIYEAGEADALPTAEK